MQSIQPGEQLPDPLHRDVRVMLGYCPDISVNVTALGPQGPRGGGTRTT